MIGVRNSCLRKARKGGALIITLFTALVGVILTISMMNLSANNTNQITDTRDGKIAYYAAEAGIEDLINLYNADNTNLGKTIDELVLPVKDSPETLNNNAMYWIDSLTYKNANKDIYIDIVGKYKGAYRKIRVKLAASIPAVYNDYGLLTDGELTINGDKTLKMNIHANGGLKIGDEKNTTMENGSVATQSNDPTKDSPDSQTNPIYGYTPAIDVPSVPISEYRSYSQEDSIFVDMSKQDYNTIIKDAPANSKIYLTNPSKNQEISLQGNMQNKFIFVEGDIELDSTGTGPVSNVTVIASGALSIDGTTDVGTSHSNEIDVIFAAGGDIVLNGSRSFESIFWSNKIFRQNGSSMAGRVISQSAILFNGSFVLLNSNKLTEDKKVEKSVNMKTWHLVPMS